jgi:hypothetical protein
MGSCSELTFGTTGNKGIVTRIAAQYLYWRASVLAPRRSWTSREPPTEKTGRRGCPFDRKSPRNASRIKPFIELNTGPP